MRRLLALLPLAVLTTACFPFGQASSSTTTTAAPVTAGSASPSSGPLLRALWVLSPVGLKLRDAPSSTGKQISTVPQGTQVTAKEFQSADPGWYKVDYQGQTGWIAAKDAKSTPPQDLVTTHPQLSFANNAAGYYFLYPANWQTNSNGNDVEVSGAAPSPAAVPSGSPSSGASPSSGNARLTIHLAASVDQLGNIPTSPGSSVSQDSYEIGGITAVKHVYQLNGGAGYEGDAKVKYASDKAILITFKAASQSDLDTWNEILESFGFSVQAGPSPSPNR
ncbi:MAG: SH3 domain-containing protein [Candidatus Dormibacteraeota bacterium]|nr:SH3 domain-containing protein [Candidatus Dormibacteraeota bacterium]